MYPALEIIPSQRSHIYNNLTVVSLAKLLLSTKLMWF